jgi:hypothetical protein
MIQKKTPTTRVKAKSQKIVSRAVKEAGFKNIKEAKEVLGKCKAAVNKNCNTKEEEAPEAATVVEANRYMVRTIELQRQKIIQLQELVDLQAQALSLEDKPASQSKCDDYLYSNALESKQRKPQWTPFTVARDGSMVTVYVWGYEE